MHFQIRLTLWELRVICCIKRYCWKIFEQIVSLGYLKSQLSHLFYGKRCSQKFRTFHRDTPLLKSLFNKVARLGPCNLIRNRLQHRFFHWNFRNFEEDLWTTASVSLCNFIYIEWKRYSKQGEKIQTLSNIYNEVFMRKQLTISSPLLFSQKRVIIYISHGSKYISGLLK